MPNQITPSVLWLGGAIMFALWAILGTGTDLILAWAARFFHRWWLVSERPGETWDATILRERCGHCGATRERQVSVLNVHSRMPKANARKGML